MKLNSLYGRVLLVSLFLIPITLQVTGKDIPALKEKASLLKSDGSEFNNTMPANAYKAAQLPDQALDGSSIRIVYNFDSPQQTFGVTKLSLALKQNGQLPVLFDGSKATGNEEIRVVLQKVGTNVGILFGYDGRE